MPRFFDRRRTRNTFWAAVCAGAVALAGCRSPRPAPLPMRGDLSGAATPTGYAVAPAAHVTETVELDLSGPQPLDVLIAWALERNPAVLAARHRVAAAAQRVPQAAALKDPMLDVVGWPFYPYVQQTIDGRMTVDLAVSQEVPWFGKRSLAAAAATEEVRRQRAALQTLELQTAEDVKRAYYQLQYAEQAFDITTRSQALLNDVLQVAEVRFAAGTTSQQDVLRLHAELGSTEAELAQWHQEVVTARAELARVLAISPDTPLETVPLGATEHLPEDLEALYQQAVTTRPELRGALAEVARQRHNVDLARLAYYPDVTWSAGWGEMTAHRAMSPMADGMDAYTIGIAMNLPVYRQRLAAGVAEATAEYCASAREHDALRDRTLRDVKTLFVQAHSQAEVLELVRSTILPASRQALDVAVREYQVGTVPFAQVIDNWRTLLRHQILEQQVQLQVRQTLAELASVVGSEPSETADAGEPPHPADLMPAAPTPAEP